MVNAAPRIDASGITQLSLSPASLDFGPRVIGSAGGPAVFTISNDGLFDSGAVRISLTGSPAFSLSANGCLNHLLARGAVCTVAVNFAPSTVGAAAATLTVMATPGGIVSAPITGQGVTPSTLTVTPEVQDYGTIVVGTSSTAAQLTVQNTATSPSGALTTSLSGAGAGDFVVASDTCAGTPLAGGASCVVSLRFIPTAVGGRDATLAVTGSPGGSATATLLGTGLARSALVVTPAALSFGAQVIGSSSTATTFTVSNAGGAPATGLAVALTGPDAGEFQIDREGCTGGVLTGAGSCPVLVHFAPTSAGAKQAQLTITGLPDGNVSATLTGVGLSPPQLVLAPTAQAFGSVPQGSFSATVRFTVTNPGGAPTGALSATLGGTDAGEFTIVASGCAGPLAARASCVVNVHFVPTGIGPRAATLDVSASPGGAVSAALSGTGLATGGLTATPTPFGFGPLLAGTTSAPTTFTITNTATPPSGSVLSIALGGAGASSFAISTNRCGASLAAGVSCTVDLTFTPLTPGDKAASLTITGSSSTVVVALTGTGLAPAALQIAPITRGFGQIVTGQQSGVVSFVVSNTGGVPTGMLATGLGGAMPGDFAILTDGCNGRTLAGGASCNIDVRFQPASVGAKAAELSAGASPGGLVKATLSGTGLPPALLYLTPTSQSLGSAIVGTPGQTASFTVTNTGATSTGLVGVSLGGLGAAEFAIVANDCSNTTLAPGGTCTIDVRHTPALVGPAAATLTVRATPGGTSTADLTGTGEPPPTLVLTPPSGSYGSLLVGRTSGPISFRVSNGGGGTTGAVTIALGGLDAAHFVIASDGCAGMTLTASQSCLVDVRFAPTGGGARLATLNASAPGTVAGSAQLSGTGILPAALVVTPSSNDFGQIMLGLSSSDATFTVMNTGGVPTGALVTSLAGAQPGDFVVVSDGCRSTLLAGGNSCSVTAHFTPSGRGARSALLTFTGIPGGQASAALSGTGQAPPALTASPQTQDFGSVVTGTQSQNARLTITNVGTRPSGTLSTLITGANAGEFHVVTDGCTGQMLAGSQSCSVDVRLQPTTAASRSATLVVAGSPGGNATVALTGTGISAGGLSVTPTPQTFGQSLLGMDGQRVTFTVRAGAATGALAVTLTGADAGQFKLASDTCSTVTLASGGSCTVDVIFSPTVAGNRVAGLTVTASPGGSVTAALDATALSPAALSLTPASQAFGTIAVGAASPPAHFSVVNTGDSATGSLTAVLVGAGAAQFSIVGDTCTGHVLAGGGLCSLDVELVPTLAGAAVASLTVSGSPGGSQSAALSGTGN